MDSSIIFGVYYLLTFISEILVVMLLFRRKLWLLNCCRIIRNVQISNLCDYQSILKIMSYFNAHHSNWWRLSQIGKSSSRLLHVLVGAKLRGVYLGKMYLSNKSTIAILCKFHKTSRHIYRYTCTLERTISCGQHVFTIWYINPTRLLHFAYYVVNWLKYINNNRNKM